MATQCLALALAPDIRVNAVAPGILDPPGAAEAVRATHSAETVRRRTTRRCEAVLFLATAASYTTGEVLAAWTAGARSN